MTYHRQTLVRLLGRMFLVSPRHRGGAILALVLACLMGCILLVCQRPNPALLVGTFNIELFPKHDRQASAAFQEIQALRTSILAVQEIRDPAAFDAARREHLGPRYGLVHTRVSDLRIGVLYDKTRLSLVRTIEHRETMIQPRARPAFEVILRPHGAQDVHVLVLHLQALASGLPARKRQWLALEPLLAKRASQGAQMIILGDFNATEDEDRNILAQLSKRHSLSWSTEPVPCTSYWKRKDGCRGSRLDHILTSMSHGEAVAKGACERTGCDHRASCPTYCEEVSDHCPVVLEVTTRR